MDILSNIYSFCYETVSAAAKSLHLCLTLRPHRRQPTRFCRPWDSPGKNTGVGCHFLLQCMKVKSESEVAQSCSTLRDPMDCSLPGSSVHGIFQARVLEWGAIAFSGNSIYSISYFRKVCMKDRDGLYFFINLKYLLLKNFIFLNATKIRLDKYTVHSNASPW